MDRVVTVDRIREGIKDIVEPILFDKGMELVDIDYRMERGGWVLRVYIDKEGGVTLKDCVGVSRELGTTLDVKGIISYKYNLEVSSPGLDRPLVKEADFLKNKGKNIKVRVSADINNRRNFKGILEEIRREGIVLRGDQGEVWNIPFMDIERARLIAQL